MWTRQAAEYCLQSSNNRTNYENRWNSSSNEKRVTLSRQRNAKMSNRGGEDVPKLGRIGQI